MPGMINEAMQEPPEGAPADVQEDAVEGTGLTPEKVRAEVKLPANLQKAYERVVLAGMKTMFSEESHDSAMATLDGEGPVEERLGQGIAALMGLLIEQSNKTMPPQVIIPAGVELLVAAGDFLKRSGREPIDDQQIGGALAVFVETVLAQAGADSPEKIQQMLQQAQSGTPEGAEQAPASGPQPTPAPPPGGMVQSAMEG